MVVAADVDARLGAGNVGRCGGAVDRVRRRELPRELAGGRVERVDRAVVARLVDVAERDRGRGVEAAGAPGRDRRRVRAPLRVAVVRVERPDDTFVVANVKNVIVDRRARLDVVAELGAPVELAGGLVERVEVAVVGAEVDLAVSDKRR
jgi:hypothetical protein